MFFGIVSLLRGIQNFNVLRALCVYVLEYDRTKFTEFYRFDILSKFSFFFFFFLYIFNFYIIQSSIQDDLLIKSGIIRFLKNSKIIYLFFSSLFFTIFILEIA